MEIWNPFRKDRVEIQIKQEVNLGKKIKTQK